MYNKEKRKNLRPEDLYNNPLEYFSGDILQKYIKCKGIQRTQQKLARELLSLISEFMNGNERIVVDIGCGPGYSGEIFYNNGFEVYGIDIHLKMLEEAAKRNIIPILADARNLPLDDEFADICISISALQWIKERKDIYQVVSEISRILKKSGIAGIHIYFRDKNELLRWANAFKKYFNKVNLIGQAIDSPRKRRYYIIAKK